VRIAFVHERSGFFGGVEQNMFDTAKGLSARGHDCLLIAGPLPGKDPERFASAFTSLTAEWSDGNPSGSSLRKLIDDNSIDALYVHKVPRSDFLEQVKGKVLTVRMVHDHDSTCPRRHKYFVHSGQACSLAIGWRCYLDLAFVEKKDGGIRLKSIPDVKREAKRLNLYDRVATNSQSMVEELAINGVERTRLFLAHPVVPEQDAPLLPISSEPHVLFVGQLIRGKGVDLLLRSLALLKCPWRATIAGDGNARQNLEALAKELQIDNRVEFLGWFPSEKARELYDQARVLAVPARWPEPFGMVGVEAMRRARPVVGFRVGGIPDWLVDNETGYLVEQQNIEAFADRLERLLTDTKLATSMGNKGFQRAASHFSFSAYIDQLVNILGNR